MNTKRMLLPLLGLIAACGDSPGPRGDDAGATSNPGTGALGDAGVRDAVSSDGKKTDASAASTDKCTMMPPAHTLGEKFFGCNYACEEGYADCDGEISNGCEVALDADSCQQCHAASCLVPALCGLTSPACQTVEGKSLVYAGRSPSDEPFLRSLVPGAAPGQLIATADPAPKGGTPVTLPKVGGSLLAADVNAPSVLWSVTGGSVGFWSNLAKARRVGDRLYILGTVENQQYKNEVQLVVANLDGSALWTKTISGAPANLCSQRVTADAQNNVYVSYGVCSSDSFDADDYMLDGKSYDSDDGTLLASFDASGTLRWTVNAVRTEHKTCRNGAESDLLDLVVANGRLYGINEVCLAEIDVATGELKQQQTLYVEMDDFAALRADAVGNLYVGSDSGYGSVLPAPSAIGPGEDIGTYPGSSAVQVSKYSPDLSHVWTRAFAHRAVYFGTKEESPVFRDFDVTPTGTGMVVAMVGTLYNSNPYQPLVIAFDTDGKITGSAKLDMYYEATALTFDSAGTAYVGGVGRGVTDKGERGVFIKAVSLK
jgi:hypothetical protein